MVCGLLWLAFLIAYFVCFFVLAIMNNAFTFLNIHSRASFLCDCIFSFLLVIYLAVGFLGLINSCELSLTFWETANLFSKGAAPFHMCTSVYAGSDFSTSPPFLWVFIGASPQVSYHLECEGQQGFPGLGWPGVVAGVSDVGSSCKQCCLFPQVLFRCFPICTVDVSKSGSKANGPRPTPFGETF